MVCTCTVFHVDDQGGSNYLITKMGRQSEIMEESE